VEQRYGAGQSIEDYCRVCKTDRMHTIVVVDGDGRPLRVSCGYCDSEHNYRGGPRIGVGAAPVARREGVAEAMSAAVHRTPPAREPFPMVSERERTGSAMSDQGAPDLEMLLRRIIREEAGITAVVPAEKWRGGHMVLRPGNPSLQEKAWPIETFFHKVVMLRNRLRTLEQQVNAADLPEDVKVKLQGYISGCYGTLTSFNVLFADEADHFRGAAE
jgi:hypothetical protein